MVVSPRARRRVLEVKLKEKNSELRELCVREAELIGVLPPETPIEPGESPPSFTPKNTLFMKAMGGMTMDNSTKQVITKDVSLIFIKSNSLSHWIVTSVFPHNLLILCKTIVCCEAH